MIRIAIVVAVSYLLGSFSPAITISRRKGRDIREMGSGNAGTTNMLRSYGKKAAGLTLFLDVFKAFFAVCLARYIAGDLGSCVAVLCVIAGHIWPVFYHFKGGKGVAASLGALLALNPKLAAILLLVHFAALLITRMVSAASICAALAMPFVSLYSYKLFVPFSFVLAAILIVKHKSNIQRILKGQESTLDLKQFIKRK